MFNVTPSSAGGGGGGGGVPPGNPNSLAYYNPLGTTITTNPALIAGSVDAFGRPQIWDYRFTARGAIWRQGAWQQDGDPVDSKGEGFVTYGSNALNNGPNATDGGYFFATPHSFGVLQIVNGVNGNNIFYSCGFEDGSADAPFGTDCFRMADNADLETVRLNRYTGDLQLYGTVRLRKQTNAPAPVLDNGFVYTHDPGTGIVELYYRDSAGNIYQLTPPSAGIVGNPNAIKFENPAGTAITDDASLVAAPVDPFGRPQIWDYRVGGAGAVYRNGSWSQDGDPTSVTGDGIVSYGPNAVGNGPNGVDGGYARIKPNRFGLAQVIGGGPLTYAWRVDYAQMIFQDNLGALRFSVDRATGNTFIAPGLATDGFLFMGNNGALHGSAARVQVSSLIANGPAYRSNQYGANTGSPGISTFKSRGLTIGSLGGILAGDVMGTFTSVGVAPDNVSIPLAATLQFRVPLAFVPAAQNWAPSELALELVALTGPINGRRVIFKVSSEGEVQSIFLQPGRPPATQAGYATYGTLGDAFPTIKVTSDAIGGLVEMGPGGANPLDTRVRRVAQSLDAIPVPQIVLDNNASGAVNVLPAADGISKLGTRSVAHNGTDATSVRWGEVNTINLNTGDLNLIDEEKDAHWTIVEERDRILVLNRKTGKRYAMALTPIDD